MQISHSLIVGELWLAPKFMDMKIASVAEAYTYFGDAFTQTTS